MRAALEPNARPGRRPHRQPRQGSAAGWRRSAGKTSPTGSASSRRPTNPEDLSGGLVEPLHVIHHAQQRRSSAAGANRFSAASATRNGSGGSPAASPSATRSACCWVRPTRRGRRASACIDHATRQKRVPSPIPRRHRRHREAHRAIGQIPQQRRLADPRRAPRPKQRCGRRGPDPTARRASRTRVAAHTTMSTGRRHDCDRPPATTALTQPSPHSPPTLKPNTSWQAT